MSPVRNQEISGSNLHALPLEGNDLLHEADGINNHTITDHVLFVRPENSGWNKVQDVLVLTDDDGMPCIISSLPLTTRSASSVR